MGVYTRLYAPIFNYNSMSEVINTSESKEKITQPRLYKRGNDEIDLDTFIRNAESEFSYWLANSGLKDKEKQQIQEAYSQMIQGINDGTVTYKVGGGWNNSIGISNKAKGLDAYGLVAGFLGDIIRSQSVYKAPEEKPDPSKIKWNGNSSVGAALIRYLYGSDTVNTKDFIGLDYDPTSKKVTSNTQRSKRFKDALEYVSKNFDDLFTTFTPADKTKAIDAITAALSAFNNNAVDDNEYLDLGRATGISNLRDWFSNTYELPSTTDSNTNSETNSEIDSNTNSNINSNTDSKTDSTNETMNNHYTNEDEYRNAKYPRSTVTNFTNRSLTTTAVYKKEGRVKLNQILLGLSKDNLLKIVQLGLKYSPHGQELNKGRSILNGFGHLTSFENNYIIGQALKVLRKKGYLHQFPNDPNSYYIPFVSSRLDQRRTGFIYRMSPDGNHSIVEMDRHDIPFYTSQWHNEFLTLVPSNKKGGILKCETGTKLSGILKFNPNRNNIYYTDDFAGYDNWHAHNIVLPWLNAYENAGDVKWEDVIKAGLDSWNNAGGFDWYNATDEQRKHGMQSAGTKTHQQYVINNLSGLNTEIAKHMSNYNVPVNANTDDRFVNGTLKGTDTDFGIQTGNRRPTIHIKTTGQDLADWDAFYKNLGYIGRYPYLDHWVPTKESNQEGFVAFDTPEQTNTEKTPKEKQEEYSDAYLRTFGLGPYSVSEKFLSPKINSPKSSWKEFIPDLIGAGRLAASLYTNNKVYNTVLPSLKPIVQDPIHFNLPITGRFSVWQAGKKQQANNLSLALRNADADADRNTARMFEMTKLNNDLGLKNDLQYDESIKESAEKAFELKKQEMLWNKQNIYMPNRVSINKTNRERAQLEATRLKSNWQSWDNFLQGFESRMRTRIAENRTRANNFYDKVAANQAEEWYNKVIAPAKAALLAWSKTPQGQNADYTEWSEWDRYQKFLKEARARANAMIYQNMADRYGLSYFNPYSDESNALFNWNRRYITS